MPREAEAEVTDNIYSNPSGFTSIPWQLSNRWFMEKFLVELGALEDALNPVDDEEAGPRRECQYCGASITKGATKCSVCYRVVPTKPSKPKKTTRVKLVPEELYPLIEIEPDGLQSFETEHLAELHNLIVDCLRTACLRDLSRAEIIKVREDLAVSREWDAHFRNLISADPKTLIWLATKHSMLGNPLAGEVFEWSNVGARANNESESTNSNKAKFAGAAALGLLAGFLFS